MTNATAKKSPFTAEQEAVLLKWKSYYPYPNMGLIEALRSVQDWNRCVSVEPPRASRRSSSCPSTASGASSPSSRPSPRRRRASTASGCATGLSCCLAGSNKMDACLEKTFGVKENDTTADGKFSWEEMECLGACEQGPSLQVNDRLQGGRRPIRFRIK